MKRVIFSISFLSCCTISIFSQVSDSLNLISKFFKHNEVGFSVDIMDNLIGPAGNGTVSLNYKYKFAHYSLRMGFSYSEKGSSIYNIGYERSVFSGSRLTSYALNAYYTGAKIGLERYGYVNDYLSFFYGIDVFYTHVKENFYEETINPQYPGRQDVFVNDGSFPFFGAPSYETMYGYQTGISPVFGSSQYFTPFCSTTFEINLMGYLSKMGNASQFVFNEKFKLMVNFNF